MYFHPHPTVPFDTTARYLPGLAAMKDYPLSYFTLTGPLYVSYLQLLEFLKVDFVKLPLIQHSIGVLLAFFDLNS